MNGKRPDTAGQRALPGLVLRVLAAVIISDVVIIYTAAVVAGLIPEAHKLDAINLTMILLGAAIVLLLLRPDVINRVRSIKALGIELEMLERVQASVTRQEGLLTEISLLLPLLLPLPERAHLLNLADGKTADYRGNSYLRTELRRLRSVGLLGMCPDRTVGQIGDGLVFDLSHYVELTEFGTRWVEKIREIDRAEAVEKAQAGAKAEAGG